MIFWPALLMLGATTRQRHAARLRNGLEASWPGARPPLRRASKPFSTTDGLMAQQHVVHQQCTSSAPAGEHPGHAPGQSAPSPLTYAARGGGAGAGRAAGAVHVQRVLRGVGVGVGGGGWGEG